MIGAMARTGVVLRKEREREKSACLDAPVVDKGDGEEDRRKDCRSQKPRMLSMNVGTRFCRRQDRIGRDAQHLLPGCRHDEFGDAEQGNEELRDGHEAKGPRELAARREEVVGGALERGRSGIVRGTALRWPIRSRRLTPGLQQRWCRRRRPPSRRGGDGCSRPAVLADRAFGDQQDQDALADGQLRGAVGHE